nr:MAG TPA: hypothetical protein [Caudoviricetes sp.]
MKFRQINRIHLSVYKIPAPINRRRDFICKNWSR